MTTTMREIRNCYERATRLALQEVERLARKIMQSHSNLVEFVMANGCASFIDKSGDDISTDAYAYMKQLDRLLSEWDEYLKLTGEPMRFTASGKVQKNW